MGKKKIQKREGIFRATEKGFGFVDFENTEKTVFVSRNYYRALITKINIERLR